MYRLYALEGSGSTIVESAFSVAGIELEIVKVGWEDTGWTSRALAELNPLGQLPTLVLPDGGVMTETAAIILLLADLRPDAGLTPPPDSPERARFLRWLIFLVAAVYPTFTYGDRPERFVDGDEHAAAKLLAGTDKHRLDLYQQLEREAGAPWFLGATFSAIDLYLRTMTTWRPRRAWFDAECPRLAAISDLVGSLPEVARVERRGGDESP